ncbi:unnamed protein product [Moneuplotes crassus]|uniref:Kinesin motor domain-containing protein n=1 Tax=Euplotes crassus TaxID=5936 RepID=A0AAD1UBI6_EUPCR|nr:unnamed protein product [Moneuplotes crassus]
MLKAKQSSEPIKVVIRCKGLTQRDIESKAREAVTVDQFSCEVRLHDLANGKCKKFTFEQVYDEDSSQKQVFDENAADIVQGVLGGYNGTVISYGACSSGKSFTMSGSQEDEELKGIVPRACKIIFEKIEEQEKKYLVKASFVHIYQGETRNLIGKNKNKSLKIFETSDGQIQVKDIKTVRVRDAESLLKVYRAGLRNSYISSTRMNAFSTRSHMFFFITIESEEIGEDDKPYIRKGVLKLVDLAPAERTRKTGCTGERLKEANSVNSSLSVFGQVVSALTSKKSTYIPYRSSALTTILRDSLGGTSKTVLFIHINKSSYNYDEVLFALKLAIRAKLIKNKPTLSFCAIQNRFLSSSQSSVKMNSRRSRGTEDASIRCSKLYCTKCTSRP